MSSWPCGKGPTTPKSWELTITIVAYYNSWEDPPSRSLKRRKQHKSNLVKVSRPRFTRGILVFKQIDIQMISFEGSLFQKKRDILTYTFAEIIVCFLGSHFNLIIHSFPNPVPPQETSGCAMFTWEGVPSRLLRPL